MHVSCPWPCDCRPDRHHDLAGQVDAHVRALPQARSPALAGEADPLRGCDAADLDVRREADPEVATLRPGRFLLPPEPLVIHRLERPVERLLVVARVVLEPLQEVRAGGVREVLRRYEVPPAHVDRIQAELPGDQVDPPFDDVRRLRPACTAIRVDHGRVRVNAEHLTVDARDPVRAREHAPVQRRRDARCDRRENAAQVRVRLRAERGDRAVVLRADLEIRDVIAAVRRRAVVLRAALDPLHRPSERLGERPDEHVLRIEKDLRAESATDLRRDAAHLRLGNAEDEGGHEEPHDMRSL